MPRLAVRVPVRKSDNDVYPVITLGLAIPDVIFESGIRTDRPFLRIVVPAKPVGSRRIPGIPHYEERRAIRQFQGMLIGCRAQKPPAQWILPFLFLAPVCRCE